MRKEGANVKASSRKQSEPPATSHEPRQSPAWPEQIHAILAENDVRQVSYVPDSGHARLINLVIADGNMRAVPLTTEEEGVAMTVGAWLGHERSVLLLQSSGVGNCINMLGMVQECRLPLLMLVTIVLTQSRAGVIGFASMVVVLVLLGRNVRPGFGAIALAPSWHWVPPACLLAGFGFYALHNTLQTNATQMVPQARGTAMSLFACCLFLGQSVGVSGAAWVVDRHGTQAVFAATGAGLLLLGFAFAQFLRRRGHP